MSTRKNDLLLHPLFFFFPFLGLPLLYQDELGIQQEVVGNLVGLYLLVD